MNLRLFDVQTSILGVKKGEKSFFNEAELIEEMDICKIDKAVTRIFPDDLELDFQSSNEKLYSACNKNGDRIIPCPIVVPNSAKDIEEEVTQVDNAIAAGALAVRIRPGANDSWEILPWISDSLFAALAERKMPLMLDPSVCSFKEAAKLACKFPAMPIIMHNVGYRTMRYFVPFLSKFENTYLSIGSNFTYHLGIEHLVKYAGAERLIFGSNIPETETMGAITQLTYAKISDEEKQLIGAGNLERLAMEIVK